jgi:hypothetical protein
VGAEPHSSWRELAQEVRCQAAPPFAKSLIYTSLECNVSSMAYPTAFYRVTDHSSGSQLGEHGFLASDLYNQLQLSLRGLKREKEKDELTNALEKHLDWYNKEPTPLISVYIFERAAWEYAQRRKRDGRMAVAISYIRRDMIGGNCLRRVRALAKELRYFFPERGWHHSDYEWNILSQIPKEAVFDEKFLE